jgi:two-component system, chemotaxis family, chemotaxis protein CheY
MKTEKVRQSVILLLDDDDTAERTRALIEKLGAVCARAADLQDAQRYLSVVVPDALVVGHDLTGGSGLDLIAWLRQSRDHRAVPVILLTGEIHHAELERAVMMGIYAFLAKPYHGREFARLLAAAITEDADPVRRRREP